MKCYLYFLPVALLGLTGCGTIDKMNCLVNQSTMAIQANAEAVQLSTCVIQQNARLVEETNKVVQENQHLLEEASK